MAKKKLILVTSPPACGKTFVTKNLARALNNCVYLDKDDLIVLSKQIYKVQDLKFIFSYCSTAYNYIRIIWNDFHFLFFAS